MALHQYIGARYVPRFMGNYDNTQIYEGLDVVDNGLGTSYIARKPVPAGTPLTDTTYWAIYGASSAAVINLQNQIDTIVNTDLPAIHDDLDPLVTPKDTVILMGDSWVDKQWSTYGHYVPEAISYNTGFTVVDYAWSGTGFDVTNGYDDQINKLATDITNEVIDKDHIKCVALVCFMNEYNDGTTKEDFTVKLQDWYDKLMAVVPGIEVFWFMNYSVQNDSTTPQDTHFVPQRKYFDYVFGNVERNLKCVPTFGWVEWNDVTNNWDTNNYYHPNGNGSIAYGRNIARVIQGLTPDLYDYCCCVGTFGTSLAETTIIFYIKGDWLFYRQKTPVRAAADRTVNTTTFDHPLPSKLETNVHIADNLLCGAWGGTSLIDSTPVTAGPGYNTVDGLMAYA